MGKEELNSGNCSYILRHLTGLVWEVFLYTCCFYWLMNKAAFSQWFNSVNPGEKSEQRCTERVGGVREIPCSCQRRQTPGALLVKHKPCGKYEIIEMG